MQIKIMINHSELNTIGKELTDFYNVDVEIKRTGVKAPSLIIRQDLPIDANYAYIPELKRYYYIKEKRPLSQHVFELDLECDVLESFKNEILNNSAIVSRQENNYNLYQEDNSLKVYSDPIINQYKFPDGFDEYGSYILITG